VLEWRPEKSRGPCTAGGCVTSVVYALGKMEVGAQSTVGVSVAGVCARCAMSQFGSVTARSGIAQTGCAGMGLLDDAGVCAWGAMSLPDGVMAGLGSARCFNTVT
jgi:hypothetical protein